jgi:hypothetical protein
VAPDRRLGHNPEMARSSYRDAGRSPTLDRLAETAAEARRQLPRDAEQLEPTRATALLEVAFAVDQHNAGWWGISAMMAWSLGITLAAAMGGRSGSGLAVVLGIPCALTVASIYYMDRRAKERAERVDGELGRVSTLPFVVEGYREWILSEQPMFDVAVAAPIDHSFVDAVQAVDPETRVELLDDRSARVFIPPRKVERGETTHGFGDATAFWSLAETLLVPLHAELGIKRVAMGGTRARQ